MKTNLFIVISFLITLPLQGQDVLYHRDGSKQEGKVRMIGNDWINYKSYTDDGETRQAKKEDLSVMFLEYGDYLVFHPDLGDGHRRFPFDNEYYDKIITLSGELIPADPCIPYDDRTEYTHLISNEKGNMPNSDIAIILMRDGSHRLYTDPVSAANVLFQFHQLNLEPLTAMAPMPETDPIVEENPVLENPVVEEPVTENPVVENPEMEEPEIMPEPDVVATPEPFEPGIEDIGFELDEEKFKLKAEQRTRELTTYIARISDKTTPPLEANKAINQALELFVSDTSRVEVSSKYKIRTIKYKIKDYLDHVKLLKYDKVEILYAKVNYVGNIRKGPDGNYYGAVTFTQIFRGFRDGELVYQDQTEKRVEVMLRGYSKTTDGVTQDLWDVLLSNIRVEQTI